MSKSLKIIYFIACALLLTSCNKESHIVLPKIISDGMIIQQNSQMTFWGKALPGSRITIRTDWDISVTATASIDSMWEAQFPTIAADNKKHQISLTTSDTAIVINDILLGEVWLASGQTNMIMPLEGMTGSPVDGSKEAIAYANDDELRFFMVEEKTSWDKEFNSSGSWQKTTPNSARKFSATAYFYAQMLRDSLKVPVGIIEAARGATPCESWASDTQLKNSVDFGYKMSNLDALCKEMDAYNEWYDSFPHIEIQGRDTHETRLLAISVEDEFVTLSMPQCDSWNEMTLPCYWTGTPLDNFDGVVWFVKKIVVPSKWIGQDLTLNLGIIDDCDRTYINGVCVGAHDKTLQYAEPRIYTIPGKLITSNNVTIAVRVIDTGGNGGFGGCEGGLRIQKDKKDAISLNGEWKYRPAGEFHDGKFAMFDPVNDVYSHRPYPTEMLTRLSPASAYYGMIYPIHNYAIAGVIWLQGEANAGYATQYRDVLPLTIKTFREAFRNEKMPFYFGQLSNWRYMNGAELGNMREAQRQVAETTDYCEMFSTLDLGTCDDIHYSNKRAAGERFARLALNKHYGFKDIVASGPVLSKFETHNQHVLLTFDNAKELIIDDKKPGQFEVAGEDLEFFPAAAVAKGNTLMMFSHAVPRPKHVRYAYDNCAEATLFNEEGLPAETFMLIPQLED